MGTELGVIFNRLRTLGTKSIWFKVFADKELSKMILDMVQQDQLMKQGVDEDGDIIGEYSEYTEMLNPAKEAGSHYTLFDTGAFYKSMRIIVLNDSFVIDAEPEKIDEDGRKTNLFEEYGEGIIGLTKKSKQKLSIEIKKRFIKEVNKYLFGN